MDNEFEEVKATTEPFSGPLNFTEDLRELVLATLPCSRAARAELETQSTSDLLVTYFNWYCRLVPAQPRRVHKSSVLKKKVADLSTTQRRGLQKIEQDISRGHDLTPHLSRSVEIGYIASDKVPAKRASRPDRDLMLYDWGLHHLHISADVKPNRYVTRTRDLLFAAFLARDAYLIDIAPHGSWYLRTLLETVVVEWPDAGVVLPLRGVTGLVTSYSEEEGLELREAGVSASAFEFEDRVWVPRDFVSTAATSMRATRRADHILNEADRLEQLMRSDPGPILSEIEAAAGPVTQPRLKFLLDGHRYGIVEESSQTFLIVDTLAE